jgi:tRNA dimethylallyltransferase
MHSKQYNLITILGPTASGKTSLAAHLANRIGSAVISADSRQLYRGMDIGTGKDLKDYIVDGKLVPYFLIDTLDAGVKYNVYEYQKDFFSVYAPFHEQHILPVLCGGSGLYIEAVLKAYKLLSVPVNEPLRKELETRTDLQLVDILASYKTPHNTSDFDTRKRTIRAIEIADYQKMHSLQQFDYPEIHSLIVGIRFERPVQKQRITERLHERLQSGMVDEVKQLIDNGVNPDDLIYYGLEYKYLTLYILGKITFDEMFCHLNIAIHQFSKRQMTWFRKMEREGFRIHWIDGFLTLDEKVRIVLEMLKVPT